MLNLQNINDYGDIFSAFSESLAVPISGLNMISCVVIVIYTFAFVLFFFHLYGREIGGVKQNSDTVNLNRLLMIASAWSVPSVTFLFVVLALPINDAFIFVLLAISSLSFMMVGAAYLFADPESFGKNDNGREWYAAIALAPYLAAVYLFMNYVNKGKTSCHQIAEGVFVGQFLKHEEAHKYDAVVDMAAELPRSAPEKNEDYLNLPCLDLIEPDPERLVEGIRFINDRVRSGRTVYVHCMQGRGRSVTLVIAWMLATGLAKDAQVALDIIKSKRHHFKVSNDHLKVATIAARIFLEGEISALKSQGVDKM